MCWTHVPGLSPGEPLRPSSERTVSSSTAPTNGLRSLLKDNPNCDLCPPQCHLIKEVVGALTSPSRDEWQKENWYYAQLNNEIHIQEPEAKVYQA